MMKPAQRFIYIFALLCGACHPSDPTTPQAGDDPTALLSVLPAPQTVTLSEQTRALPDTLQCFANDSLQPLIKVIDYEYHMLTGGHVLPEQTPEDAHCILTIDASLNEQEYHLELDDTIRITGGSYQAIAMASVTWMQSLRMRRNDYTYQKVSYGMNLRLRSGGCSLT